MEDAILKFVGEVVAYGGGAAVIAFIVLRIFGEKWLDSKFSKQIKDHEFKLRSVFDKISIIQKKEFEILPKVWHKLQYALHCIEQTKNIKKGMEENKFRLNEYSENTLDLYLKDSNLSDFRISLVKNSEDKDKEYKRIILLEDIVKTAKAINDLSKYAISNLIFIDNELAVALSEIDTKLRDTLNINKFLLSDELIKEEEVEELIECIKKEINKITPLFYIVDALIRKRLSLK